MPYIHLRLASSVALTSEQTQQLADGVTQIMVNILRKQAALVAVSVEWVPTHQWFIASLALTHTKYNSAFISVYITQDTNNNEEKSQAIQALYDLLQNTVGVMAQATYIVLHSIDASDWGYAGQTQYQRYGSPKALTNT